MSEATQQLLPLLAAVPEHKLTKHFKLGVFGEDSLPLYPQPPLHIVTKLSLSHQHNL